MEVPDVIFNHVTHSIPARCSGIAIVHIGKEIDLVSYFLTTTADAGASVVFLKLFKGLLQLPDIVVIFIHNVSLIIFALNDFSGAINLC